ncbi:uncharacterized protein LOC131848041 [Achroia grisella]|uniref:uncharacterized protein LOC131848041 n=1 Tax=Achroia grisella TaxID=688607 RepID=UPI0027D2AD38|nr:uncharacterized protein LOC131848041 [Achroia grisella]
MVERLHRQLKAAIMCHANPQWTEVLPFVMLGIRSACKEDLKSSATELVYGEPLRLPGEFLHPTMCTTIDPTDFVARLHRHIANLSPTPGTCHNRKTFYVQNDIFTSEYVFLRRGPAKRALKSPYTGPYKVLKRDLKTFTLDILGKETTVTIDRLKAAYMAKEDKEMPTSTCPTTQLPSSSDEPQPKTTRSGRIVRFPNYYRP